MMYLDVLCELCTPCKLKVWLSTFDEIISMSSSRSSLLSLLLSTHVPVLISYLSVIDVCYFHLCASEFCFS